MMNDLRIYDDAKSWVYIDQIEPPSTQHIKPSVHAYNRERRATSRRTTRVASPSFIPLHLLSASSRLTTIGHHTRLFSSTNRQLSKNDDEDEDEDKDNNKGTSKQSGHPKLTHLTSSGAAYMVPIHNKQSTTRTARAICSVHFSNPTVLHLIRENSLKKGDVLGVARIAGIMAAKRTPDLIPLCHPIMLTHVSVDLTEPTPTGAPMGKEDDSSSSNSNRIDVSATVTCDGKTGVEMEALTAAMAAALTVYDMCKAVDKGMRVEGLRVVLKEGGKSGRWVEGEGVPLPTESSGGKS